MVTETSAVSICWPRHNNQNNHKQNRRKSVDDDILELLESFEADLDEYCDLIASDEYWEELNQ